jgi:pimeloyl-ACP methyl ester carboxylesterase
MLKTLYLTSFLFASLASATTYQSVKVDNVNIFYREAGSPDRPTILLLHGFPTSSHMYRELIPRLATKYHVVAPDFPGFGHSSQPTLEEFDYTFANLTNTTEKFVNAIGLKKFSIYVQDYGSPVGFRLWMKDPTRIQAIISQNGNAYEEGLSPFWAEYLHGFWKQRTPETEAKVRKLLTLDITKFQYSAGFRNPKSVDPDAWAYAQQILDRPGNDGIQLALFFDYQTNVKLYPEWHAMLRKVQPPVLAVWGKNDPIFSFPGAEAFKRDVPKAEIHALDTGHFALEEEGEKIASLILNFLARNVR